MHQTLGINSVTQGATNPNLLYVSDGYRYVYVYTYPGSAYVMTLDNVSYPSGLCTDQDGNVFVTQNGPYFGDIVILEYAHGGKVPIAKLFDPGAQPVGCAVDPANGDVAVASYAGQDPSESGSLAIFTHGSGSPQKYVDRDLFFFDSCTYDRSGNLFVDGQDAHLRPRIAEMPKGGSSLITLKLRNLPKNFGYPAGLQWDGKYLAFGDFDNGVVYQISVSLTTATIVGSTKLTNGRSVEQFYIVRSQRKNDVRLVGPNSAADAVRFWKYPVGGEPTSTISGLDGAFGAVVSKVPR